MSQAEDFLRAVLTPTGAAALAAEGAPGAWVARVAASWLSAHTGLHGTTLPGTEIACEMQLGPHDLWSGRLGEVEFEDAPSDLVASLIAALLGDPPVKITSRDSDVAKVAAAVAAMVAASQVPEHDNLFVLSTSVSALPEHIEIPEDLRFDVGGTVKFGPGSRSRPKQAEAVRVSRVAAAEPCTTCGEPSVSGDDLVGCICLAGMLGDAKIKPIHGGWSVQLASCWGASAVAALQTLGST